ncbi:unnamed protein product [Brachionus calyciflorus]|uniref:Uncharacterized protein n=1 Tax=Brachionus calyciflorus TaxID=104777 RepID=A0A814C6R0_9BILA|nr:unnamed protein product [Brachionus calyciflorus]
MCLGPENEKISFCVPTDEELDNLLIAAKNTINRFFINFIEKEIDISQTRENTTNISVVQVAASQISTPVPCEQRLKRMRRDLSGINFLFSIQVRPVTDFNNN